MERARMFLRDVGRDIPSTEPKVTRSAEGWRPGAWRVDFGPTLRVEVSAATGKVVALFDALRVPTEGASSPIGKDEAKRLATEYIKASGGLPEGARFSSVNGLLGDPRDRAAIWQVVWDRYVDDILVLDDTLNIQIDASSGALIGFSNNFLLPVPKVAEAYVSRAEAVATASAHTGKSVDNATTGIVIVDPDALRGVKPNRWRSVFAWAVVFDERVRVLVAQATGEVLEVARPMRAMRNLARAPQ